MSGKWIQGYVLNGQYRYSIVDWNCESRLFHLPATVTGTVGFYSLRIRFRASSSPFSIYGLAIIPLNPWLLKSDMAESLE